MFKVFSPNFSYALLLLLGVPFIFFLIYLGGAAWSLHQAEKDANEACAIAAPGKSLDGYISQLKKITDAPAIIDEKDGLRIVSTSFKSNVVIARYVCVAKVRNNYVESAEVIYID